jgi:hypothetical protein
MNQKVILREDAEKMIEEVQSSFFKVNNQRYITKELAIYATITHDKCSCGNLMRRGRLYCDCCRLKKRNEDYKSKTHIEWDGVTPLVLFDSDVYFFSEDEIYDYINNEELDKDQIEELQFMLCEPCHLREIDLGYWSDVFPDNFDEDIHIPDFMKKLNEFNEFISKHEPISWTESKFRTTVKLEFE